MTIEHPGREQVMALLDGELPEKAEADVRTHLETCRECRAVADALGGLRRDLDGWQVEAAPRTLTAEAIAARAARHAKRPDAVKTSWWGAVNWRAGRVPLVFAGGAVIALALIVVWRPMQMRKAPQVSAARMAQSVPETTAPVPYAAVQSEPATGPLIARTASVRVVVADADAARAALARIVAERRGSIAQLSASGERPALRTVAATVRVPASELEGTLAALRSLGRVQDESQASEDVTAQSVDLDARLANARRTEERLAAILQKRTGNVSDVLAVEREAARVRGEIERMEAERKRLTSRVALATIDVRIEEERRADLTGGRSSIATDLRNAAVDGARNAATATAGAVGLALRIGPTLALWALLLAWPIHAIRRRTAHR